MRTSFILMEHWVESSPVTLYTLDYKLTVHIGLITRWTVGPRGAGPALCVTFEPAAVHSRLAGAASQALHAPAQHTQFLVKLSRNICGKDKTEVLDKRRFCGAVRK